MKKIVAFIALLLLAAACASSAQPAHSNDPESTTLELINATALTRTPEVVELPLATLLHAAHLQPSQASSIVALNAATGEQLPTQLYSTTPAAAPDTLLLLVTAPAHSTLRIRFHADPAAPKARSLVYGRAVPERKDDFAWENEQVTYRIYGPALQATGEITSGIDVWSKRIPDLIIDDFYRRDAESSRTHNAALSYHKDNGIGLDSYEVGPTPGCGGTAVFANGKLIPSKNYATVRILASGPIRFAFEITYAPWDANGVSVAETRRIILDAGSHLNRIQSTYTWEGKQTLQLSAGLAVHTGAEASIPVKNAIAAVWDTPQDPSAGRIATGLLALPGEKATSTTVPGQQQGQASPGLALLLFNRSSGQPFTYYAGSGWSKADMPTAQAWSSYLTTQLQMLEHPLVLQWKGALSLPS